MKVAVASPSFCEHPTLRAELAALHPDAKLNTTLTKLDEDRLIEFLAGADAAILGLEPCSARVIDALPDLKIVSKLGTGLDCVDLGALRRRGIRLGWTPGVNAPAVAELAIALSIIGLRRLGQLNAAFKTGGDVNKRMGRQFMGRVVGIHGYGAIGQIYGRLARAFGCTVIATDIVDRSQLLNQIGGTQVSLDELLATSEVLSLHLPLDKSTRGLYSGVVLDRLKPGCLLVNTARGGIIDQDALKFRLMSGRLTAACADVLADELNPDPELLNLPNFFGTPHVGASSEEARLAMGRVAIRGLIDNRIP
ncbi:MAG: phosphoglycerate dehydrogenase [Alphaproteobacteria bacterium]|nr:phosphoglycerate dehydrogenase [Alphaproteobacteria bacterium]